MKKMTVMALTIVVFILTIAIHTGFAESSDVLVIANNSVAQADISAKDLGNIFLGKKKSWDGGGKIVPVTLQSGPTHESFMKAYAKKSASQFSTFWKQAIFTGQGIPPKSLNSEEEIVKFVAENAGAIGYISASTAHDGVKVLAVK